uniref:NADH-ubiquinone oxidoreductase chain 2 n=1 Tax=Coleoptera sp. 1 KM-2017 TaxID=2219312 RepID=A0A346RG62_9COLE|nr:NADH dehydrogenase subunit 2 [Coleoptera sp. 1 KM-2017]
MKYSTNILFLAIIFMSTLIVISSNNYINMWMGLEVNMMSFIPLMYKNKNTLSSESCMLYFLVQSFSSMMFLYSILLNPMMIKESSNSIMMTMTSIALAIKMGLPPFHYWFPQIMEKLNWNNCLILMTWQKIAPMFILSQMTSTWMIQIFMITSTTMGAIGGLNQTSIRKILAFSSINHMGWMIACMKYNQNMWMVYLMLYSTISYMIIKIMNYNSIYFINQMFMNSSTTEKVIISTLMMSLGGLPPFLGFLPKWMVIQSVMASEGLFIIMMMILMSLITLFYYLRMMSSMLMINSSINKWMLVKKNNKNMNIIFLLNMLLPSILIINMF